MFSNRQTTELSTEEYNYIPSKYLEPIECLLCGQTFREVDNIGRSGCRLHPGIAIFNASRNDYFYQCCNRHIDSNGCTPADHITNTELLPIDDAEERIEELMERKIIILPCVYVNYGIKKPLEKNIIFRSTEKWREKILCVMKFPTGDREIVIDIKEEREKLSNSVFESKILTRHYSENVRGEKKKEADLLEENWRHILSDEETQEVVKEHFFNIPFFIISRIEV